MFVIGVSIFVKTLNVEQFSVLGKQYRSMLLPILEKGDLELVHRSHVKEFTEGVVDLPFRLSMLTIDFT